MSATKDVAREPRGESMEARTIALSISPRMSSGMAVRMKWGKISSGRGSATPLFLKYPLSAMLLPEICRVFSTRLVYVLRPLADIEATRQRRDWDAHLGAAGAQVLYPHMFETLIDQQFPTLVVRYFELLAEPARHAAMLAGFCGLPADDRRLAAAAAVVRGGSAR